MQADLGNGVNLKYEVHGSGYPLILITGFGATLDLWGEDFIAPLAQLYQVITLDNRGIGGSEAPDGPVTIELYARDVIALMDRLGLPTAHILGISMGGMIAQQIAVSYPQRVTKLILGATTCSSKMVRKNPRLVGLLLLKWAPRFAMRSMLSRQYIEAHPAEVDQLVKVARAHRASALTVKRQSEAVSNHELADAVTAIRAPTLILAGTGDQIINHENSDVLAKKIRSSRLIKYPGVGHIFPLERREESKSAIMKFLQEP